jgi:uncharacterized protein (TIGR02266 family)
MKRTKVVLADDVELFLMLENTFFNRGEFEIITARSGQELLKIIKASSPAIAFINLEMPELPGDECCRLLKGDIEYRHIPVVIVAPCAGDRELDRCREAGCDAVVTRPINRHDFMETSRKFLEVRERVENRLSIRVAVKYAVVSGDIMNDFTADLNSGGMFLATERLREVGSTLHLDFVLPGMEEPIRCLASVAWVNGPGELKKPALPRGMGIRFLDITDTDMKAINRLLESGLTGETDG